LGCHLRNPAPHRAGAYDRHTLELRLHFYRIPLMISFNL
jgi:hypothetical protein